MGLARLFVPRRKENVLKFVLSVLCFGAVIYYYSFPSRQRLHGIFHSTIFKRGIERGVRYVRPSYTALRSGPGENGQGVFFQGTDKEKADKDMKDWFMNVKASDMISLDRSIPDARRTECKNIKYDLNKLPKASVVIIFTDEAWSPLLRTVHSVVNRSPPELLEEVILVDDNSQREELKSKLEDHIKRFDGLVRVVRKTERQGLIRAKIVGAKEAVGEVVVFLDSHCEANEGWLEPLVQRIYEKRTAIICPIIDHIAADSLSYHGDPYATSVGGFSWALHFTWEPMSDAEKSRRKNVTEYIKSPTMAGGLLAANRNYFFEIGSYDSMMDIWGGENLEISFRVWMCGGSIEFIPCSHVGHIFRSGHPYNMTGTNGNKDVHGTNSKRLAEVWMDEYKRLYYMHRSDLVNKDVGDLSDRKALRSSLGCKSFRWYLDNIVPGKFVMDEDVLAFGVLYTVFNGYHMCVDTLQRDEKSIYNLGVFPCQGKGSSPQMISLSRMGHLRRETNCAHSVVPMLLGKKGNVQMIKCDENSEKWSYENSMLKNIKTGLCLSTAGLRDGDDIILETCNNNSVHQMWTFVNPNAK